jgi:hypothetical protein
LYSFGHGGKAIVDFGRSSQIRALLSHPGEGKIIAGGISGTNLADFSLERYHP